MIFWVLFFMVLAAELIFLPCYLFAPFCRGGNRQIISKCVCAGLFILIGVFAMLASSNFTPFAVLMLLGLFVSSWGDYFLGISMKGWHFVAGVLSFMAAHIFYVSAYSKAVASKIQGSSFLTPAEISAIVAGLILLFLISLKLKMNMGKMKALIMVYTIVIMTMLVKAISLSIRFISSGIHNSFAIVIFLGIGAVLFVISDAVLSLILFAEKDTRSMTVLNLITYFSAQILLASSILFV